MKISTRLGGGVLCGLGLAMVLAVTVIAQDVKVDYDKSVNFAKYKTFSAKVATEWGTPFAEKRALDEVTNALVANGWKSVAAASADATVLIHGATESKRNLNTFYNGYAGYGYRGYGAAGMGTTTTTVTEYTVGTMVVDIFDAKTKQLIWRGSGSDEISDKADKNQKKIANATKDMFKKFPPVAGK